MKKNFHLLNIKKNLLINFGGMIEIGSNSETKAKILVIDDEKSIRITLKKILEKENYYVETARDFQSARTNIENLDFDLLLVDLVLPKVNGIDIIKHFNEDFGLDVPVIFLTGEPNLDTAVEALRIGAFDYIEKPIQKSQLIQIIDYALTKKKYEDEDISKKFKSKYKNKLNDFKQKMNSTTIKILDLTSKNIRKHLNILLEEKFGEIPPKYRSTIEKMDELINDLEIEIKKTKHLGQIVESIFNF